MKVIVGIYDWSFEEATEALRFLNEGSTRIYLMYLLKNGKILVFYNECKNR